MAVPKNATILRGAPLKAGVMLGVSPSSDPTFDVEIARATSSGAYQTIGRLTPKGEGVPVVYTDLLPADGFTRTYKARAVKDGWLAGDYTATVSAKPIQLPEIGPNITPLTGKGIGASIYLSTTPTVKYGSPQTQAYYRKRLRVNGSDFLSRSSTRPFAISPEGSLNPNSTSGTQQFFYAPIALPLGSVTKSFSALAYRGTTSASITFNFTQRNSTGGLSVAGKSSTATGFHYLASTAFSFTISTAYSYFIDLRMASASTDKANAQLVWFDIVYDTPTVQGSI